MFPSINTRSHNSITSRSCYFFVAAKWVNICNCKHIAAKWTLATANRFATVNANGFEGCKTGRHKISFAAAASVFFFFFRSCKIYSKKSFKKKELHTKVTSIIRPTPACFATSAIYRLLRKREAGLSQQSWLYHSKTYAPVFQLWTLLLQSARLLLQICVCNCDWSCTLRRQNFAAVTLLSCGSDRQWQSIVSAQSDTG